MSTQQSLKTRIRTATNILHIAEAMEIVASVQFRKLVHKMEHLTSYHSKLNQLNANLNSSIEMVLNPLFKERPVVKLAVIIMAGDKGLCGSYNDRAFKAAEKFLKDNDSRYEIELYLIGRKALDYFKNKKWNIKKSFVNFSRTLNEVSLYEWAKELLHSYLMKEFDSLWVISTYFKNMLSREPRSEKLLPMTLLSPEEMAQPQGDFIFEPKPEEIYEKIIPYYFYVKLQTLLFNSHASELSSRIVAMKSSSKNAKEMIEELTLIKNKNRQLMITNEILEITAGAESLK